MTAIKPVICAYVPPDSYGHPRAFLTNLSRFTTHHPLLLFSECAEQYKNEGVTLPITPLKHSPEFQKVNAPGNKLATNNLVFLKAMQLARDQEFTHVLYLEEDCRVNGDGWDKVVMDEFLAAAGDNVDVCVGGTVVCFCPYSYNREAALRWEALRARNIKPNIPIASYGGKGSLEKCRPSVLVNGALGVYPVALMERLFDGLQNTVKQSADMTAWDSEIGGRMWQIWKERTFDHVHHLSSIYSSYGDVLTSENDRRTILTSGLDLEGKLFKAVGVHQIKSNWPGPEKMVVEAPVAIQAAALSDVHDSTEPAPVHVQEQMYPAPVEKLKRGRKKKFISDTPTPMTTPVKFPYRVDILIVTHAKDAEWLVPCLKSIGKFCTGFGGITVVFPRRDVNVIQPLLDSITADALFKFDIKPVMFDEVEGKGHLHHMVQKCMADIHCPDSDLVLHTDSDCVFFTPTTPADYFVNDKPVLCMTPYSVIEKNHPGHFGWKAPTELALKEPVTMSCMERHPAVHWRELYNITRSTIESKHGTSFENYVLGTSPTWPYGYCEFVTLGAVALREKRFQWKYEWHDLSEKTRPDERLIQFWSHSPPGEKQQAPDHLPTKYDRDADGKVVPAEIIADLLK